jgi:glycosyltransferase involved in cell wall biosynthesis
MVRALQFEVLFEESEGWRAKFVSRHSEGIIGILYGRHSLLFRLVVFLVRPLLKRIYSALSRLTDNRIIRAARNFDLVCLVKTPSLSLCRRLKTLGRPAVLMDLNDAIWLHKSADWKDLDPMLAVVDGVICENECVAAYARNHNANVFVISDAPQIEKFDIFRPSIKKDTDRVVIGWIGGAGNIGPMYKLVEPLEQLFRAHEHIHLRIVGAHPTSLPPFEKVRFSCCPVYDQKTMIQEVLQFHIGLFPLFRNDDGLARGTLKAKVYMSGEAVAVCENYGENPGLIESGVNGYLASSLDEWYEQIDSLIRDPQQQKKIAAQGLQTIRSHFTARHVFEQMISAYDETVDRRQ